MEQFDFRKYLNDFQLVFAFLKQYVGLRLHFNKRDDVHWQEDCWRQYGYRIMDNISISEKNIIYLTYHYIPYLKNELMERTIHFPLELVDPDPKKWAENVYLYERKRNKEAFSIERLKHSINVLGVTLGTIFDTLKDGDIDLALFGELNLIKEQLKQMNLEKERMETAFKEKHRIPLSYSDYDYNDLKTPAYDTL